MPRRSRGVLLPPVSVTRPRRTDLYLALRNSVVAELLAPGERLPSSRKAAADYGVSRGLMEEVYAQLMDEGLLERAVGRGTFIAHNASQPSLTTRFERASRLELAVSARGQKLASNRASRAPDNFRPFNAGVADTDEFPWKTWQRILSRAAHDLKRDDMNFTDPRGLPALRSALAHHLAQLRGMRCTADQIIIFNSSHQALYSMALLLLNTGDLAWMEDPGYPGARAALELAGATIVNIPVDREGLRVTFGLRHAPTSRLAYVTPSNQFPTGVAMSLERRIELLKWTKQQNSWVLEDDYDGEFRYVGQPCAPLYSLDPSARVLYVGTLSKSMFVSLRLAFAVVPTVLVNQLANIRSQFDSFSAPLIQLAMSRFMDEGHFSTHVSHMRGVYAAKSALCKQGLAPLADCGWTWESQVVGLQIMLRHPDARVVRRTAEASGLALHLLSSYRHVAANDDGLLLRFGGLGTAAIRAGIDQLVSTALRASRENPGGAGSP